MSSEAESTTMHDMRILDEHELDAISGGRFDVYQASFHLPIGVLTIINEPVNGPGSPLVPVVVFAPKCP